MRIRPKNALKGIVHMRTKLDETPAFCGIVCGAALLAGCAEGPTAAVGGNASGAWLAPGVGGIYCVESGAGGSFPYWVGAVAGCIAGDMDLVSSIAFRLIFTSACPTSTALAGRCRSSSASKRWIS